MLMDPDGLFRRFLLSVQKSQKNGRVTLTPPLSLGWLLLYILTSGRSGLSIGRRRLLNQQQVDTHEGKKGNLMDRLKDQTFPFRSLPSPLSLSLLGWCLLFYKWRLYCMRRLGLPPFRFSAFIHLSFSLNLSPAITRNMSASATRTQSPCPSFLIFPPINTAQHLPLLIRLNPQDSLNALLKSRGKSLAFSRVCAVALTNRAVGNWCAPLSLESYWCLPQMLWRILSLLFTFSSE